MTAKRTPKRSPANPARLDLARVAHLERLRRTPPVPYGIGHDALAGYLERTVQTGKPDFNRHAGLPPGADA